jgi:hypothetical protein
VKRRRTRLVALGLLSIAVGLGCLALVAALLLLPVIKPVLPDPEAIEVDARSTAVNAYVLLSIAVATMALGVGSIRCRRWVRPLMLTLAWTWLIAGLVVFPYSLLMSRYAVLSALPDLLPSSPLVLTVRTLVGVVMGVVWLLLPAVFVLGYGGKRVEQICIEAHPEPAWTDRAPTPVLGLAVGLGAAAYITLPTAVFAVLPLGPWLVTGWIAVVLTVLGALLCAWLARATYRLEPAGWWGTLLTILVLGVSASFSVVSFELVDLYAAMGYPEAQLELFRQIGGLPSWLVVLLVLGFTGACVAYMVSIRPHFLRRVE